MSDEEWRELIVGHCKWIATFDRDYAVRAFMRYDELMPWLELRRKHATNV